MKHCDSVGGTSASVFTDAQKNMRGSRKFCQRVRSVLSEGAVQLL